ncbi:MULTISPECIES: PQQ-dependent sugar dehydrogenase [unclassified Nocardioides]|uniref:PQQ-dependent sugar dehydrogenase n=1 Tax=unclassified Nocardioides TaxID=2615069 RepID=UPI0030155B9F
MGRIVGVARMSAVALVVGLLAPIGVPSGTAVADPVLPSGFQDRVVIGGLDQPTVVDFAADGTAFVGNQAGVISTVARAGAGFAGTPAPFADLTRSVQNYWDRGLVGLAVDPALGTGAGRDFVYVAYAYDRDPRDPAGEVPAWGNPAAPYYDDCPAPASLEPGGSPGCVASIRVTRLAAAKVDGAWTMTSETELLAGGCLQFPSHGSGAVHVGPDRMLYVTAGEGASFDTADRGQFGGNPCGDPVNEGGSLRAQDLRTTGDPLGINGSLLRIDPLTGEHAIAAYGFRNPWRFAFRPDTDEVWVGDVGAGGYDEVNRLTAATSTTAPRNFGWPCFEGPARTPGWDELDVPLCESLYAGTAPVAQRAVAPYLPYSRSGEVVPGDGCPTGTASVSGVQFLTGSAYPADLQGALVFADFARGCVWSVPLGADGQPRRARARLLVGDADSPVDLTTGPEGDLYYVDYGLNDDGYPEAGAGAIHRVSYDAIGRPPVARISADPPYSSVLPLSVELDASASRDPDGDVLGYSWDLDGDGTFGDDFGPVVYETYTVATPVTVAVRVTDGNGGSDVAELTLHPGNDPPTFTAVTPAPTLTWAVGDPIPFSAAATDLQDGTLPASAFTWSLAVSHCPSVCHVHPIETRTGVASGTFTAPDHEYPSRLVLRVRATDAGGFATERSFELAPKTVDLRFATTPVTAPVSVLGAEGPSPQARRVIVGSTFTVAVPPTVVSGGRTWRFAGWSDSGARVHQSVAPARDTSYVARYVADAVAPAATARLTVRAAPARARARVRVDGVARRSGWAGRFDVGERVRVVAPARVRRAGQVWVFRRWNDGGRRAHTVTVRRDQVLRAVYVRRR